MSQECRERLRLRYVISDILTKSGERERERFSILYIDIIDITEFKSIYIYIFRLLRSSIENREIK